MPLVCRCVIPSLAALGALVIVAPRPARAQPGPDDAPVTSIAQVAAPTPTPPPVLAPPAAPESWFTFGALSSATSAGTAAGARLQIDLFDTGGWSAGLGGTLLQRGDQVMGYGVPMATGTVYLAYTHALVGPLHLRAQAGVGGETRVHASAAATRTAVTMTDGVDSSKIVEGALLLGAHLGDHWELVGGPIAQVAQSPGTGVDPTTITIFVGLGHR